MRKLFVMGIFAMIGCLFGCNGQKALFKSVEVEEFEKVIADKSVVLLDVRTPEEYAEGHIDGAINIDVQNEDFESKAKVALSKDKVIALYCRSGRRSKKAATILANDKYKVVELNTGYLGWKEAGK